jgi:hypothetical protein
MTWYNNSWNYRKKITITENSNLTSTNYPVKFTVDFVIDKMKSDFSDLRFTENDGATLLDYYIESYVDSTSAEVWVVIPSITASSTLEIYMYYDNSAATNIGDIDNVYIFRDDASSDRNTEYIRGSGATLNYNSGGYYSFVGGFGGPAVTISGIYDNVEIIGSVAGINSRKPSIVSRWDGISIPNAYSSYSSVNMYKSTIETMTDQFYITKSGAYLGSVLANTDNGVYYTSKLYTAGSSLFSEFLNTNGNTYTVSGVYDTYYSSGLVGVSYNPHTTGEFESMRFNFFSVRKYVIPEPTSVFGSEENEEGNLDISDTLTLTDTLTILGRVPESTEINISDTLTLTDSLLKSLIAGTPLTIDYVSSRLVINSVEYSDFITLDVEKTTDEYNGTSNFSATFWNTNGQYNNTFNLNDEVVIYSNTNAPATTKLLTGIIENISFSGKDTNEKITISGGIMELYYKILLYLLEFLRIQKLVVL